jgi:signal transduction histidine kinase
MIGLQQATSSNPDQQQRLLKLQADITTKMNELASTIAAMREHGFAAAKSIVDTDLGRTSMVAVTADLAAIMDSADAGLRSRLVSADAAEARITLTFVIASFVAMLALAVGAFLLARAYRRAAVSERTLQATLDSVREGVAAFDQLGGLRAWNSAFLSILGVAGGEILQGAPLIPDHLGSNKLVARIRELDAEARATGRAVLVEHQGEQGVSIEIFHNPMIGGGFVTTLLDVTEQRKADDTRRQAQKLEAMGQMTGGVAHDFNNLLTIIIGSLGLLRRAVGDDPSARERIDMMSVAAERTSRLTRQLLAFARRQPLQPEIVNLDHIMHEILGLVRRAAGESIQVECVTAGGFGTLRSMPRSSSRPC